MMEVVSSGKRLAFEHDYIAVEYAEGKAGSQLPQLRPGDNKLLNPRMLGFFNALLGKCFRIDPKQRPCVDELLFYLKKRDI